MQQNFEEASNERVFSFSPLKLSFRFKLAELDKASTNIRLD